MSEEIVSEELVVEAPQTPRLKQEYKDVIIPELEKEFKHDNPMQIPASRRSSSPWASAPRPATRSSSKAQCAI